MVVMAGFFVLTRTRLYLERPWIDLPIFIVMAAGMKWLALVLADQSATTGIPPHAMAMIQMGILVVFASVGFAGTFLTVRRLGGGGARPVRRLADDPARHSRHQPHVHADQFQHLLHLRALLQLGHRAARAQGVRRHPGAGGGARARPRSCCTTCCRRKWRRGCARARRSPTPSPISPSVFVDLAGFSSLARQIVARPSGQAAQHLLLRRRPTAPSAMGWRRSRRSATPISRSPAAWPRAARDSQAAMAFARDLIDELQAISADSGIALQVRIGIHTGPAVGGVIGSSRLAYDYWGDTMNVAAGSRASRRSTASRCRRRPSSRPDPGGFVEQSVILKGIGQTSVYVAVLDGDGEDAVGPRLPSGRCSGGGGVGGVAERAQLAVDRVAGEMAVDLVEPFALQLLADPSIAEHSPERARVKARSIVVGVLSHADRYGEPGPRIANRFAPASPGPPRPTIGVPETAWRQESLETRLKTRPGLRSAAGPDAFRGGAGRKHGNPIGLSAASAAACRDRSRPGWPWPISSRPVASAGFMSAANTGSAHVPGASDGGDRRPAGNNPTELVLDLVVDSRAQAKTGSSPRGLRGARGAVSTVRVVDIYGDQIVLQGGRPRAEPVLPAFRGEGGGGSRRRAAPPGAVPFLSFSLNLAPDFQGGGSLA